MDMENLGVVGFFSKVGYPITSFGEVEESRDNLGLSMFQVWILISKTLNQRIKAGRSRRGDFTLVCVVSTMRGREKRGK